MHISIQTRFEEGPMRNLISMVLVAVILTVPTFLVAKNECKTHRRCAIQAVKAAKKKNFAKSADLLRRANELYKEKQGSSRKKYVYNLIVALGNAEKEKKAWATLEEYKNLLPKQDTKKLKEKIIEKLKSSVERVATEIGNNFVENAVLSTQNVKMNDRAYLVAERVTELSLSRIEQISTRLNNKSGQEDSRTLNWGLVGGGSVAVANGIVFSSGVLIWGLTPPKKITPSVNKKRKLHATVGLISVGVGLTSAAIGTIRLISDSKENKKKPLVSLKMKGNTAGLSFRF